MMYALKNKVQLIGNLGRDPEMHETDAGKKLARLSIGISNNYRNASGEKVKDVQWHKLIAWGKIAEIAQKHLKKGFRVAVDGRLITRNYTDKSGAKRKVTEVYVNELLMLAGDNS